jgi:RimJ/RimL family protein N-acetyltransferase
VGRARGARAPASHGASPPPLSERSEGSERRRERLPPPLSERSEGSERRREAAPALIEAGPVTLRRLRPDDAPLLHEAVTASVAHLRPWMPWIALEPVELAQRRDLLQGWDGAWDAGTDRHYGIFPADGTVRLLGVLGVHSRVGPDAVELGYWLRPDATGRGLATSAARGAAAAWLTEPHIVAVEIHHDTANVASEAIPRRLGFHHVRDERRETTAPGECGTHRIWRATAADLGSTAP